MAEVRATGRRHAGVELGRAVAMLGVVLIHVPPAPSVNAWLRPLAEFAVPYFFVVSGFMWARAADQAGGAPVTNAPRPRVRGPVRRLLALYVLGFVVYGLLPLTWSTALRRGQLGAAVVSTAEETLAACARAPLRTLLDGPPGGFHLWFLAALAVGLVVVGAGLRAGRGRALAALAVGLFAFGLLAGRYAHTAVGVPLGWSVRNGPFQSVLLVGTGCFLATHALPGRPGWRGSLLLLLGQLLVSAETAWVGIPPGAGAGPDVYSAAVLPLGVGSFLLFYDLHITSAAAQRVAQALGATTLGVFLWHVLLRVPVASVLAFAGLYPHDGSNPWWGFIALFSVSVVCVAAGRAFLAWWTGRGARRGLPVELEAV